MAENFGERVDGGEGDPVKDEDVSREGVVAKIKTEIDKRWNVFSLNQPTIDAINRVCCRIGFGCNFHLSAAPNSSIVGIL